jgi:hypothetical protein
MALDNNNSNVAAAIAGFAFANDASSNDESVNDSYNIHNETNTDSSDNSDNSDNSVNTDVGVEVGLEDSLNDNSVDDSYNDASDNSDNSTNTDVDVSLADAFKDSSVNDSYNDSSDNSDHSDNSDNSTDTDVDVSLNDAFKDSSVHDSYNPETTNTTVDVALNDALNDKSTTNSNNDSSDNSDHSFDLNIEDSFNPSDSDWLDMDGVQFDAMSIINNALNGSGDNQVFTLNQISEMSDNDTLNQPSMASNSPWAQLSDPWGGETEGVHAGDVANDTGEDGSLDAVTSADATAHLEAFNMNIAMGANIQYNTLSVVGGDSSSDSIDHS